MVHIKTLVMTSIEWLIEQLKSIPLAKDKDEFTNGDIMDIVNKAKEMHRKEIIDAVGVGSQFDRDYLYGYHDKAEQYYQETFKKFSLMDETPSAPASDKTMCEYSGLRSVTSYIETKENTYTEEQLKLAYIQGYNRGVQGNPNHMESYIEFLKQQKG